jgi:hypothetical protein
MLAHEGLQSPLGCRERLPARALSAEFQRSKGALYIDEDTQHKVPPGKSASRHVAQNAEAARTEELKRVQVVGFQTIFPQPIAKLLQGDWVG